MILIACLSWSIMTFTHLLHVARNVEKGRDAVRKLEKVGLHPVFVQLDVTSKESIAAARREVEEKYGRLDVLVNNAAVLISVSGECTYNWHCLYCISHII